MNAFEYLFKYLQAAEPDLKTYLLSANVYWTLPVQTPAGMPPYPRFSLGWLLLYRRRLSAAETRPERLAVLTGIEAVHDQWPVAWAGKAALEFEVRLKQWTRFINEYRADPAAHRSRYAFEVQRRTMLALLRTDAGELPEEQVSLLAGLDSALRGSLVPGPFIQDPAYQPAFPEGDFWFLYGELG